MDNILQKTCFKKMHIFLPEYEDSKNSLGKIQYALMGCVHSKGQYRFLIRVRKHNENVNVRCQFD